MADAVVKIGGSLVTDKAGDALRVDADLVRRLAAEILAARERPKVLVHGAGSYGHRIVQRTGIHRGLTDEDSLLAMGETQRLQLELNSHITYLLLEAGLPVMPVQASASAVMESGTLYRMDLQAVDLMVAQGLIPLLYGVPAVDAAQGCSILSGDQIAPYVARRMDLGRVIHVTDVDGVFEGDPHADPAVTRFDRVDRHNLAAVRARLAGSSSVDVTGGMAGKVAALIDLARRGPISRIVSGRIPGRLTQALDGEDVGTLITWETP